MVGRDLEALPVAASILNRVGAGPLPARLMLEFSGYFLLVLAVVAQRDSPFSGAEEQ